MRDLLRKFWERSRYAQTARGRVKVRTEVASGETVFQLFPTSKSGNMAEGALTASQNMYNEFAKVLGLAQQNNERPDVHVAPEGLASQFVYICSSVSVT